MKSDFDTVVSEIAELTKNNAHCEAIKQGLTLLLNTDDEVVEILSIIDQQQQFGYLTDGLVRQRRAIYDKMIEFAKAQLTQDQFIKFYMAI